MHEQDFNKVTLAVSSDNNEKNNNEVQLVLFSYFVLELIWLPEYSESPPTEFWIARQKENIKSKESHDSR